MCFGDLEGYASSVEIHFRYVLAISLMRMHRNSDNSASGLNRLLNAAINRE